MDVRMDSGMAVRGNQHRPEIAEEEKQHAGDQAGGKEQLDLEVADGGLDRNRPGGKITCGAVIPCGRLPFRPSSADSDTFRQVHRIGRRLLLDAQGHCRHAALAVAEAAVAAFDRRREADFGDLAEQDRLGAGRRRAGRDRQVLQVVEPSAAPGWRIRYSRPFSSRKPPEVLAAKPLDRRLDLVEGNAQFSHPAGVQLYLELAHLAADRDDLRDAGNRHQPRAQHPVGVLAGRLGVGAGPAIRNGDQHDLAHDRRHRPHARHTARGRADHRSEPLADHLPGAVDIDPQSKAI